MFDNSSQPLLSRYSRVSPSSSEWARIEYLLQLSLGTTTASVKNIWSVASPHNTFTFEKKNKGKLTLDSWLETALLDQGNKLEKVLTKGFDFPSSGLMFPTGHLTLSESTYVSAKLIEVMLCKVSVGKSYCVNAKNFSTGMFNSKSSLPPGFESIYLYVDEEGLEETQVYRHDFIIFDNTQVLPVYLVQYEFDPKKEEALNEVFCDICQESVATIYCINDDACLCHDDDDELHNRGNKVMKNHQRCPINERPKNFGMCQEHNMKFEFYCSIDHVPLCVYCKINGSHSSGDMAWHPLVQISIAYSKSLAESKEADPLLEKRKTQITELLSQIDSKIKEVNRNSSFVEERLYQILLEALSSLQEETQKKMNLLIADQLELKRQFEQIQWLEAFLRYQQEVLQPASYLHSWSKHIITRTEILNNAILPVLTDVQPDIRVDGKLTVVSEGLLQRVGEELAKAENEERDAFGKFRSQVFFQHNLSDKASKILKQIVGANIVKNIQPNNLFAKSDVLDSMGITQFLPSPQDKGGREPNEEKKEDRAAPAPPQKDLFKGLLNTEDLPFSRKPRQQTETKAPSMGGPSIEFFVGPNKYVMTTSLKNDAKVGFELLKNASRDKTLNDSLNAAFTSSQIITDRESARILYQNIPFTNPAHPPSLWMAMSSATSSRDSINMQTFSEVFRKYKSSILLLKVGDEVIGGYASDPWIIHSAPKHFGTPACFLFNLKRGVKAIAKKNGPIGKDPNNDKPTVMYQWICATSFSWGTDLEIQNFKEFAIQLESYYTVGMGSEDEGRDAFGVRGSFIPNLIEVWTIIENS